MFKSIEEVQFSNGDEFSVIVSVRPDGFVVELRVWDDFQGNSGSVALYDVESLDKVITMLQTARKEII